MVATQLAQSKVRMAPKNQMFYPAQCGYGPAGSYQSPDGAKKLMIYPARRAQLDRRTMLTRLNKSELLNSKKDSEKLAKQHILH